MINNKKLEHLTPQSDEAIQNIASLYRKDNFAIGKLRLGDKWIMSGVGDPEADDDVFRVYKADGKLVKMKVGPFTSSEITDETMGGPVKKYVDTNDSAVKEYVKNELVTSKKDLRGYVEAEVKSINTAVKNINDKLSKQDLSSVYKNGQVAADKVLIGNKWLLVGGNDDVIRIHKTDGSGLAKMELGPFTSAQLYDKAMGTSVKSYVDNKYTGVQNNVSGFNNKLTDINNKITNLNKSLREYVGSEVKTLNNKIDTRNLSDLYKGDQFSVGRLMFGNKWLLSGGRDNVVRINNSDGSGLSKVELGQLTSAQLFDKSMNTSVKGYIDTKHNDINTNLNTRLGSVDAKIQNMNNQYGGYNTKINDIYGKISGQTTQINNINNKVSGYDTQIKGMQSKFGGYDTQINNINSKFGGYDTQFKNIQGRLGGHDNQVKDIYSKISGQSNQFTTINNRLGGHDTKIGTVSSGLQGTNAALKKLSDNTTNQINTINTNVNTLSGSTNTKFNNLTNKVNTNTGQINTLSSKISGDLNVPSVKTGKLLLGDKWILTGSGKDSQGYDDSWLRLVNKNGQYYGGIAASTFYDSSMGSTIKNYIDNKMKTKAIILNNVQWNQADWVTKIEQGRYFKQSDPDGTIKHFMAIHPHYMNTSHPTRNIVYLVAMKAGKQFLMWRVHHPDRHEMPNPWHNASNDKNWRGNIL